jgi:hypothetical protein
VSRLLVVFILFSVVGCGGHDPGQELGTYAVTGKLTGGSCGEGALGATDPWKFDIKLSRYERELFWENGRESITGSLSADGVSFVFDTRVEKEVTPAGKGQPACALSRVDHAEGTLSDPGTDVESFVGTISFEYQLVEGSECPGAIGPAPAFQTLPCDLNYELDAERTAAP